MELNTKYSELDIMQVEKYVVKLHQFVCSKEFQVQYGPELKKSFYKELEYAKHFAQIARQIFLKPTNDIWIAIQVDRLRAEKDRCIKAYKIPSKKLLFSIFNIEKELYFQQATIYKRHQGVFNAVDGYAFASIDNYLAKVSDPLIQNTTEIIDFIGLEYEKET